MTAYVHSPAFVFADPDRTADELRAEVEEWARQGRMMTVAGVDAAGDEAPIVVTWDEVSDYRVDEVKPDDGTIVMVYVGED